MKTHFRFIGNNKMKEDFCFIEDEIAGTRFSAVLPRSGWFRLQFQIAAVQIAL
jgi:hypothetical protein